MRRMFEVLIGYMLIIGSLYPQAVCNAKQKEVRVVLGDTSSGEFGQPIRRLSMSLKRNPGANKFRLQWIFNVLSTDIDVTAVYDRQRRTLKYYASGFNGTPNGLEKIREHYLYTNVKDKIIHKIAQKHKKVEKGLNVGRQDSFFPELRYYGCKRIQLP